MILICPNCDAEYKIQAFNIPNTGIEVECLDCGQNWFEYNIENIDTDPSVNSIKTEEDDLKQLAAEELSINLGKKIEKSAMTEKTKDSNHTELLELETPSQLQIQNRLKDSSDLLKKAQGRINEVKAKPTGKNINVHNSTIFGFLTSSFLFLTLLVFYLYSQKFLQVFPNFSVIITSYVLIIDIILGEILFLFRQVKDFLI